MTMKKTWKRLTFVLPALLTLSVGATAGQINMILSDVDIQYQGEDNTIYDAGAKVGGNQEPTEADELASTVIEVDGNIMPYFSTPGIGMFADMILEGLPSTIPLGGTGLQPLVTTGFGFEWFTSAGHNLHLQIDKVEMLLTSGVFFFTAEAVVVSQNLPEGIEFDGMVNLSYTATAPAVSQGQSTPLALSSGALTVTGIALVPEPGAALLFVTAGLAYCMRARRANNR